MRTKILKIGFEIEAEWNNNLQENTSFLSRLGTWTGDATIRRCYLQKCRTLTLAEYRLNPLPYTNINTIKNLFSSLQKCYKKSNFHFNKSCGFHLHISFSPIKPPELMSYHFISYFNTEMARAFPKEYAARKENKFCVPYQRTRAEIYNYAHANRYHAVNYNSLQRHKTIELRIFRTTSPLKMFSFVLFSIETIENFLQRGTSLTYTLYIPDTFTPHSTTPAPKSSLISEDLTIDEQNQTATYNY